jgi:hypothetical protein
MRFNPDEYITVHERIEKFYAKFKQGRIITTVLEHDRESGFILIRAEVYREVDDALPAATGHAYELRSAGHVQQGSYVEVCETSSVGRALALLGFETKRAAGNKATEKGTATNGNGASSQKTAPAATSAPNRQRLLGEIGAACKELNEATKTTEWDNERLQRFAREKFKVTNGTKDLSVTQLEELLATLKDMVENPF